MTQILTLMSNWKPNWHWMFWLLLAVVCVGFGMRAGGAILLQLQAATEKVKKTPYEHRTFSFDYSNLTDDSIKVDSVKVLKRLVNMGGVQANGDGSGFSTSRGNCTVEALLNTQAHFLWWKRKDALSAYVGPKDPSKRFRCSVEFPRFDVEAEAWRCHYTLVDDNTWVGRFEGVALKPPGVKPKTSDASRPDGTAKWIQFQFRNLTGKEICFLKPDSKLTRTDSETLLYIPNIPEGGRFHGFTAHIHNDSIYRPTLGSRVELAWCIPAYKLESGDDSGVRTQTIEMPSFAPKADSWYCYFTLSSEGIWEATLEGIKQE